MHSNLNAQDINKIALAGQIRRALWGRAPELAEGFALDLSQGWKERGIEGVRAACWSVSQDLAEVPGAWDLYVKARTVAEAV